MFADPAWRPRVGSGRWLLPIAVLVIGVVITYGFAVTKQSGAIRERELLFASDAGTIRDDLASAIDARTGELRSAINFVSATHPGPIRQFERFLEPGEGEMQDPLDFSVVLVEPVEPGELDALVDRERRLGDPDFAVFGLGRVPGQPHLIITRTVRDLGLLGLQARGLDISLPRQRLIPGDLPADDIEVWGLESDTVIDVMSPVGGATSLDDGYSPAMVILAGPVEDPSGGLIGWALSFVDLTGLSRDIRQPAGLGVDVSIEGIEGPVLTLGSMDEGTDAPELADRESVITGSLRWDVEVAADESFGPSTGLLDQLPTWKLGLAVSAIAALGAFLGQRVRRRLDMAAFELEHVRALASTDSLTGLLNRMGFVDSARRLPASDPATLFFVDLDGFKAINDHHGHEAGDAVLRQVAMAVRSVFRPTDLVGRLGGDEFVIFTPGVTGRRHERDVCDRIGAALDDLDADITCSIGVSARAAGLKHDVKEMIRAADEAMYAAKRAGGSRSHLSH